MDEYIAKGSKAERVMELLFKALKGESLSAKRLSEEYHVSTRSITRDIDTLKCFLSDRPEVFYGAELVYSSSNHCYTLSMDTLFSNRELAAIAKILVGCRTLSKAEITTILEKLEANTSVADRSKIKALISKEILHYREPGTDCSSVIDNVWRLTECIGRGSLISVFYYRMDRQVVDRRLLPLSIMFSDGYFYLIACRYDRENGPSKKSIPLYFRIDRIKNITVHRQQLAAADIPHFDEGDFRNRSLLMWPGPDRHITFEFTGPSVQAILDKLPTARIIAREKMGKRTKYTIEADTTGNGIKMFLLSQGAWVKVLGPQEFVEEMKAEIGKMLGRYE